MSNPASHGIEGKVYTQTAISLRIISCDLKLYQSATFLVSLEDNLGRSLETTSVIMGMPYYDEWITDDYVFDFVASQLGLVLTSNMLNVNGGQSNVIRGISGVVHTNKPVATVNTDDEFSDINE